MRLCPWSDFNGCSIYEGDVIAHPSGERGTVVFVADGCGYDNGAEDQWRVRYDGQKYLSRLCLQIGDKGRFDPLEFARMEPAKQFTELQKFVPGFDFADNAGRRLALFEKRTEWNRMEKQERGAAAVIDLHPDTPAAPVDEESLIEELNNAGKSNATLATRRERRTVAEESLKRLTAEAEVLRGGIDQQVAAASHRLDRRADDLRMRIKEFEDALAQAKIELAQHQESAATELQAVRSQLEQHVKTREADRDELKSKIDSAEPLPAEIDVDELAAKLDRARTANDLYRRKERRDTHIKHAEAAKSEADALTAAIELVDKEKREAITAAAMPVKGLGFGANEILYNDLPFAQASDAVRLRVSVAIAASQDPELRILRIKEGSLLDKNGVKLLDEICEEHDMQAWLEVVMQGEDDPMAWVIEAGTVKHGPAGGVQ
jgi:hypothetical protein